MKSNASFQAELKQYFKIIVHMAAGSGISRDDLFQEAALQFIEAQRDFDPARGIKFQTFFLNGKMQPALLRHRAAQRSGDDTIVENIPAPADFDPASSLDAQLCMLTSQEELTLDAIRDTEQLAARRGVSLRRAQQIQNATISSIAQAVRARLGLESADFQLSLF